MFEDPMKNDASDSDSDSDSDSGMSNNSPCEDEGLSYVESDHSFSSSEKESTVDESDSEFDQTRCDRMLAKNICRDVMYLSMVSVEFTNCFLTLQPEYQQPDFETIMKYCLEIYGSTREKLKDKLRALRGRISLSIDVWRMEDCSEYMCLSSHFINNDWKLRKRNLNFRMPAYPYCGDDDEFYEVLWKCVQDWDIGRKVCTVSVGSPLLKDRVAPTVKSHFREKGKLLLDGRFFSVRCCWTVINLMAQDGLHELDEIIGKVDVIILGRPIERQNFPWDGIFSGLKKGLKYRGSIAEYDVDDAELPTEDEWNKVQGICTLLEVIHNVAILLLKDKRPTANIYFQYLWDLRTRLAQEATSLDSFISTIAKKMLQKFDCYWEDMFLVLAISAVLDPRFKMKCIEFFSLKHYGDDANSTVTRVLDALHGLYDEYVADQYETDPTSADSEHAEVDIASGIGWLEGFHQFVASNPQPIKSELDSYLDDPVEPCTPCFQILNWWKTKASKYPILSRMARDVLAIPISVAIPKSAFYIEPNELDHRYNRLRDDTKEALICTGSWFQNR